MCGGRLLKRITKLLTLDIIDNARPNCKTNWPIKLNHPVPFEIVWPTLGTPLSDATEEKVWRKLIQRALYVKSRDPTLADKRCRLGCQCLETQLHLVKCRVAYLFWLRVRKFLEDVMGIQRQPIRDVDMLLIFNMKDPRPAQKEMVPVEARAFIRHAWNCFYRDFVMVETHKKPFVPEYTFKDTVENFTNAVMAYGETIHLFKVKRMYTSKKKHVPEEVLKQFPDLIKIQEGSYDFKLTGKLTSALHRARSDARAYASFS